jgi:ketosteroid isomerase-like protein
MRTGPDTRLALIESYYQAYGNSDQQAIEAVLHDDFTFTSPQDDRIGRAAYLQRCWPNHEYIGSFNLLDVCADDDSALIRYRAAVLDPETAAGRGLRGRASARGGLLDGPAVAVGIGEVDE